MFSAKFLRPFSICYPEKLSTVQLKIPYNRVEGYIFFRQKLSTVQHCNADLCFELSHWRKTLWKALLTLFTLEDVYGLTVSGEPGDVRLSLDADNKNAADLASVLKVWRAEKAKLERGEISSEDYDRWRYHYPEYETSSEWGKVPSDELSDDMRKRFREMLKPD